MLNQLIQREQYMLNQLCNTLKTRINCFIEERDNPSDDLIALKERLEGEQSWPMANSVELALVDFYDDNLLQTEWHRRLAEVDRLPRHLAVFYKEQALGNDPVILRPLLSRLVTDLQWVMESKRVIRFNESQMRKKIVGLFLCAFVLFFLPTIFRTTLGVEFDNLRLYYIFTAATSGILGAAFSQLTSIQSRVNSASLGQVRAMNQLGYIVARSVVGAGAGLIMFYLLQSGLLSGVFFPEFIHTVEDMAKYQHELVANNIEITKNTYGVSQTIESTIGIGTLAKPGGGLSLLVVWCLLAGFSEKLIPGILNNKAKQATNSTIK